MSGANLQDVFVAELRDVLDAEEQLILALPKMASAAECRDLREGFQEHLHGASKRHRRLEQIFELIGEQPKGRKCDAMLGLLKESRDAVELETGNGHLRDALMISNAKKVDFFQMSAYDSLKRWADELGLREAADLLNDSFLETRAEEEKFEELDAIESGRIGAGASAKKNVSTEFDAAFAEPPVI